MIGKKVKNPSKGSTKPARIGGLVDYIRAPEQTNELEKCEYSNGRGFITDSHNGQRAEMIALAQEAVRSKDPINHYILSWREGEKPTPAQIEQAIDVLLDHMKLQGHQIIYGLHSDTDNYHVHIAINRVHPDTHKVVEINKGFDLEALHQAVALIEHEQGWQREKNARYEVSETSELQRTDKSNQSKKLDQKRIDMEVWTGEKSAVRHTIEDAAPIIKSAKSWQELHARLAQIGMRYVREGSGAKIYVGDVGVKASSADRSASINQLQKRLGIYQPSGQQELAPAKRQQKDQGVLHPDARTSGLDVDRVRRTAGRSTGRSEPLRANQPSWKDYTAARQADKAARTQRNAKLKAAHEVEKQQLRERLRAERKEALEGDWRGKGMLLNAMKSVIAAQQAAEKLELKERHEAEKKRVRAVYPAFPSFEQWLRENVGERAAEEYRNKDAVKENRIYSVPGIGLQHDLRVRPLDIRDFKPSVQGREVVYQSADGRESFIDRGKHVAVLDTESEASIRAAMQLASQKFGGTLEVTGADEFKQMCVRIAVEQGIRLQNPELQDLIRSEISKQKSISIARSFNAEKTQDVKNKGRQFER